jgi:Cu/Zn superoxide dismutase
MEGGKTHYAVCVLYEDNGSGVNGVVKFTQTEGGKCRIQAEVTGLKAGKHGFHVHEFGKNHQHITLILNKII